MPRYWLALRPSGEELSHFFDVYKELEPGKGADVRGWEDRAAAEQVIAAAFISGHGHEAASWRWG